MTNIKWPLERAEGEAVGLCSKRLRRIGEIVKRYVDAGTVTGVITVVARRGKIAHLEVTGTADMARGIAMREDAIFRIYSMSKLVTSAAVLMLMEDGHFLLKEPVKKWLPEFGELKVAGKGADGKEELLRLKRDVTIHDLLTHLGGLSYDLVGDAREKDWTLADFVPEFCKKPLKRQPGEVWDYSAATDVLGRLVEVVSGKAFDVFLQERIFGPLGMVDTGFWVPPEKLQRFAENYKPGEKGGLEVATALGSGLFTQKPAFFSGGGGLVSTTSDYLRFALMLLNGGEIGGVRLLGRKTVELMAQDHLPPGHPVIDINGCGFGLGVEVVRTAAETKRLGSPGQFGWGGAACTQVWIDPQEEMVSMLMLQLFPGGKFPLMDLFLNAATQAVVD